MRYTTRPQRTIPAETVVKLSKSDIHQALFDYVKKRIKPPINPAMKADVYVSLDSSDNTVSATMTFFGEVEFENEAN